MALTKEAKLYMLKAFMGQVNEDGPSSVLPIPMVTNNSKPVDFQNALDTSNQGITITKVVKILNFENRNIVFINGNNASNVEVGAILVFDTEFRWIQNLFKHYTNTDLGEAFNKWYDVKVNTNNGCAYGLNLVDGKVSFFELNSFFSRLGLVSETELAAELFYTKIFDIETEQPKEDATSKTEVLKGNALFTQLRTTGTKFGFNVDTQDNNVYSLVIWDKTNKKVFFIRFNADLGTKASTDSSISWEYNEAITLEQGEGLVGESFEDISIIDIQTGERNISKTETSIGSIALSTQKDAGTGIVVPLTSQFDGSEGVSKEVFPEVKISETKQTNFHEQVIIDNTFFQSWLNKIRQVQQSGTQNDNFDNLVLKFSSTYSGQQPITININNDDQLVKLMLNANNVEIKSQIENKIIIASVGGLFISSTISLYNKTTTKILLNIGGNTTVLFSKTNESTGTKNAYGTVYEFTNKYDYIWNYNYNYNRNISGFSSASFSANTSFNFDIKVTLNATRVQQSLQKNTTSQILIDKVQNADKLVYKIIQKAINSYEGNQPVFISPNKFYIPLKEASTGRYSIFEFNGDSSRNSTENTQTLNTLGTANYSDADSVNYTDSFTTQLNNAIAIISVKSNIRGTLDASEYILVNSNKLVIKGVTTNEQIVIEYTTKVGQPSKVVVDKSTSGEDIFIYGIDDNKELGTQTRAIIGVGDNSLSKTDLSSKAFGFNLYRKTSGIDYDAIAEVMTDSNVKIHHVFGFRNKNMLVWYGFNEDYSKYVSFKQIYPDSFNPYTYSPYSNPTRYFVPERLNINKFGELKGTIFDREFEDVAFSGSTLLATTTIKAYDANNPDNDTMEIYGATNKKVLTFDRVLDKSEQENINVNLQLSFEALDNIQAKNKTLEEINKDIVNTFSTMNNQSYKDLELDKAILTYTDGTTNEVDAKQYFTIDETNDLLRFGATFFKLSDKTPSNLKITLKSGKTLATYDFTQAIQCSGRKIDLTFEVKFKDKNDQLPYMRFDETPWNRPYEPEGNK